MDGDISAVCPLVVPIDTELTAYEGYISVQGAGAYASSLWLKLTGLPPGGGGRCAGATLALSEELADILQVSAVSFAGMDGGVR